MELTLYIDIMVKISIIVVNKYGAVSKVLKMAPLSSLRPQSTNAETRSLLTELKFDRCEVWWLDLLAYHRS